MTVPQFFMSNARDCDSLDLSGVAATPVPGKPSGPEAMGWRLVSPENLAVTSVFMGASLQGGGLKEGDRIPVRSGEYSLGTATVVAVERQSCGTVLTLAIRGEIWTVMSESQNPPRALNAMKLDSLL